MELDLILRKNSTRALYLVCCDGVNQLKFARWLTFKFLSRTRISNPSFWLDSSMPSIMSEDKHELFPSFLVLQLPWQFIVFNCKNTERNEWWNLYKYKLLQIREGFPLLYRVVVTKSDRFSRVWISQNI